ncbi:MULTISPECIES: hypothetical protein [Paenibacillus]|uniref:hypothetical protein n=1 Tax=Paenibacillus TaxID=44249 RepID=UPI0022B917C6|nr:hypothetical protein [Paenibacillus caseinilyticus]MCZ8520150.1 hypothetical protein [Paenibacillus caseinilyticus]
MIVKLSRQESEFLCNILDQWEHEEDTKLAESVYAKLNPAVQQNHGQLEMDLQAGALIIAHD